MLGDFQCPQCGTMYEDKIVFSGEVIKCEKCGVICDGLPSFSSHFRLKYDNKKDKITWGAEGYRESQYWSQHDKQAKGNIFPQGGTKASEK